jgi:hypothetical protein
MQSVFDDVDCRAATCSVNVPLATLTVSFPGHSNVHTYVRVDDKAAGTASGSEDSSATWKTDGTTFTLLRGVYDVLMVEGNAQYVVDAVDCRGSTCSAALAAGTPASPTATPTAATTPTPTPTPSNVSVTKTFVSADDSVVTWKIAPSSAADLFVWDAVAAGCQGFGGADCGSLTAGGAGTFTSQPTGDQYFLVAQDYTKDGDACEVSNTAAWAASLNGAQTSVSATYKCSGASTMGWGMFGIFVLSAVGMTWIVRRKSQWQR